LRSGGDIYIHGLPNQFPDAYAFAGRDWTRGCIAVNNHQMKEIVRMVPIGTTIEILP
jgi:murein L,D-transpeptidase YafK